MNLLITVIEPHQEEIYAHILSRLKLPVNMTLHGRGTASKRMLDVLGLERKPKRAVFSIAAEEATRRLMEAVRRELYIDAPGNGISIALPIKSVGGAKTLEFLSGSEAPKPVSAKSEYENEMILALSNEGYADTIMEAARSAGARGGTVLHGKGTARGDETRFYNVNITDEKELVMIVTPSRDKAAIMSAILKQAGPASPAGTVVFSLPVSCARGLGMFED